MTEVNLLFQVRDLKVHFPIRRGLLKRRVGAVRAVDGVSFDVKEGETLGLVGESGSGKSTTGRAMLQLERPTGGEAIFQNIKLTSLGGRELRSTRRNMQMVFQDPHASLNPRIPVGRALREAGYKGSLQVAAQESPTGPLELAKLTRQLDPDQLSLI